MEAVQNTVLGMIMRGDNPERRAMHVRACRARRRLKVYSIASEIRVRRLRFLWATYGAARNGKPQAWALMTGRFEFETTKRATRWITLVTLDLEMLHERCATLPTRERERFRVPNGDRTAGDYFEQWMRILKMCTKAEWRRQTWLLFSYDDEQISQRRVRAPVHPPVDPHAPAGVRLECAVCGVVFPNAERLNQHESLSSSAHHPLEAYDAAIRHTRVPRPDGRFGCPFCPATFGKKATRDPMLATFCRACRISLK